MSQVLSNEFPFVEHLPKREKTRLAILWDHFQQVKQLTDEHGILVPYTFAAELAGVSRQRIFQLVQTGDLVRVEMNGHPFITEKSFLAWAQSERKAGRPTKAESMSKRELWRVARNGS